MVWSHVVEFAALMEEKAVKQMVPNDQQVVKTMLFACLCQCNLAPRLGALNMVPIAMVMESGCPAICHQEGLNLMV